MDIEKNLQAIRRRMERAGGAPGTVTLTAAAKTVPAELVREAVRAGVDAVGENRVQEMLEKYALGAYDGVPLHFIGRLQKNKVNKVTGRAELIHSVDSDGLAALINICAEKQNICQSVLAQINIAGEDTKGGFSPGDIFHFLEKAADMKHISVRGLMCIPPPIDVAGDARYFERMRRLFDEARSVGFSNIQILSMGMSGDFEAAIRAGSTMIRVGSALFGKRLSSYE